MSTDVKAKWAMVAVVAMWGMTFPLIKGALTAVEPLTFMGARFGLAALSFLLMVFVFGWGRTGLGRERINLRAWGKILVIAVLLWLSYFLQVEGMKTVSASVSAFVTGSNVVMVPLLLPLFSTQRPSGKEMLATLVCFFGLFFLADPRGGTFAIGAFWTLLSAFFYAVFIVILPKFAAGIPHLRMTLGLLLAMAFFSFPGWVWEGQLESLLDPWTMGAILFCAIFATVLTFYLQANFQPKVSPIHVALIFSLEPVFAACFSGVMLKESLHPIQFLGAALVFVSLVLPVGFRLQKKHADGKAALSSEVTGPNA